MTWVLVMRPTKGLEYQIYEGKPPPKAPVDWGKTIRKVSIAVLSNFVWWYITK